MVYFLRFHSFYALAFSLVFFSCELKSDRKVHRLRKNRLYVLKDTMAEGRNPENFKGRPDTSYLEYIFSQYDLVNIHTMDSGIVVKLRYADTANFLHVNFYDGLRNAYFNCPTAINICNAQYYLKRINPGYSLVIFDASRPQHIQQLMWDSLKMHPDVKYSYLAPPYETSLHNYGCAVDAGIIDLRTDSLLDMGSEYDQFDKISQPAYEWRYLASGELSQKQYENRLLLRKVMQMAKMNPINSEWWHFSLCKKPEAVANYSLIK